MKKITKALLIAAALMLLLTGCFKQDTTIKFSPSGKTTAEISIIGTDDAFSFITQGQDRTELMDGLVSEINDAITNNGTKESVEQVTETVDGEEMYGIKYKGDFASLDEMLKSDIFSYINGNSPTSLTADEVQDSQSGIRLRSIPRWYGTEYFVEGNMILTEERFQDEIGVYTEDPAPDSESAKVNMTFKFPFISVSKANGALKLFRNSFSFTATKDNPFVPICVHTITISIPILIAALIILALLIALLSVCKKLKKLAEELALTKEPDVSESISDTFEDAENAEETVFDASENAEETITDVLENAEETVSDAAEDVNDAAEEFITHDAQIEGEEETENTDSGDNE